MKPFTSIRRCELKGRGTVFTVHAVENLNGAQDLNGKIVVIDGKEYVCAGVERFGTRIGTPIGIGEPLGLLTKPVKS